MTATEASDDALRLLLRICERQPPEVTRQWISFSNADAPFDLLTRVGLLRHVDNASTVRCFSCDETHEAAVEMVSPGRFRAFCPDAGYQEILAHDLEVYAVDIPALAALIRRGLEMRPDRPIDELAAERLWRLGEQRFGRIAAGIYFARQLDHASPDAVYRAIRAFPERGPAVIFTSSRPPQAHGPVPAPFIVAPLGQYAELVERQLRFDQRRIGAALKGEDSQPQGTGVQFAPDYRQALIGKEVYSFTPKQAEAVRAL